MDQSIYSRRLLQIMELIANSNGYITATEIAKKLHVSNRTVTRELKNTEYIFSRFDVTLELKKKYGYRLIGEQDKKEEFASYLKQSMKKLVENRPEQRRERLLLECLQTRKIDKLSYFAYLFNVSEGTISNDLKIIEEWLNRQNLSIQRGQLSGIKLVGREEDIHRAKANFLHDQMVKENVEDDIRNNADFDELEYFIRHSGDENSIMNLLNKDILFSVISTLKDISVVLLNNITRSSYLGLIIHMTIAIDRIKKGETIEMAPEIFNKLKQDNLFSVSKEFAHYFETSQNIVFPEEEIAYILMHLKSIHISTPTHETGKVKDIEDEYGCARIVEQLILKFSKEVKYDYTTDEDLFIGLMAHMKPALNRISYNLSIRNPLLEQIKNQYNELFQQTKRVSQFIKDSKGNSISEHEIGYLTLHFGAAVERKNAFVEDLNKLNIAVVCPSGIGVSVLLVSTIKNKFHQLGEVKALSIGQLSNETETDKFDAVVTTMTLEECPIPVLQVNPLLEPEDVMNLTSLFNRLKANKRINSMNALKGCDNIESVDFSLIEKLELVEFESSLTKEQVIDKLIDTIEETKEIKKDCVEAILEREKLGEVLLDKKEFVLYHASLPTIHQPYIIFFRFCNNERLLGSKELLTIGLVLLLPKPAKEINRVTLSNISYQIYQQEELIQIIKTKDQATLIESLKKAITEKKI